MVTNQNHIDIRSHLIQNAREEEKVNITSCPPRKVLVDVVTMEVAKPSIENFCISMGRFPSSSYFEDGC